MNDYLHSRYKRKEESNHSASLVALPLIHSWHIIPVPFKNKTTNFQHVCVGGKKRRKKSYSKGIQLCFLALLTKHLSCKYAALLLQPWKCTEHGEIQRRSEKKTITRGLLFTTTRPQTHKHSNRWQQTNQFKYKAKAVKGQRISHKVNNVRHAFYVGERERQLCRRM